MLCRLVVSAKLTSGYLSQSLSAWWAAADAEDGC